MLEHWSNKYRQCLAIPTGLTGLIGNILLIYIIFKHTPESVKTYSVLIMVMTISDLVNSFCSIMTSFRMAPKGPQLFILFQGLCEKVFEDKTQKSRFCMFWYAIQVESTLLNHIVMVFSYIFRVLVITQKFESVSRTMVHIVTYGYSICHMGYLTWVYFKSWEPIEKFDEAISRFYPEIINSSWTYSGILNLNEYPQIVFNILVISTPWLVFIAAIGSRWKIGTYLDKFQFSDTTRLQHRSLLNVLLYQTIGPFFYTITVILYVFIGQSNTQASALLENFIPFPLLLMVVASPIITLYLITPYRMACIKIWEQIFGANFKVSSGVESNVVQPSSVSFPVVT